MFLKLFKSNRPQVIFVLLLIVLAAWLPGFYSSDIFSFSFDLFPGPLYKPFNSFGTSNILLSKITALAVYFCIGFLLVRLNTKYFFIPVRTQLPAVIYLLLISGVVILQRFTPVLIVTVILLIVIDRLFQSFKYEGIAYQYFDTAFLISFTSLFYFNAIFFIVFVWLGLVLLRHNNWREWVFTILGFLLPYLFLFAYYYTFDKDFDKLLNTFASSISTSYNINEKISELTGFLIIQGFLWLITSFFMMIKFDTKKTHARRFFHYFLWIFILTVILYFVIPSFGIESLLIIAIPLTFLFSHYFIYVKLNFFTRLLFTLLILSTFYTVYITRIIELLR